MEDLISAWEVAGKRGVDELLTTARSLVPFGQIFDERYIAQALSRGLVGPRSTTSDLSEPIVLAGVRRPALPIADDAARVASAPSPMAAAASGSGGASWQGRGGQSPLSPTRCPSEAFCLRAGSLSASSPPQRRRMISMIFCASPPCIP